MIINGSVLISYMAIFPNQNKTYEHKF